jgi:hypothetical protein
MTTTTKPRGNLSKTVVLELVKDATPEQINALFTGKDNKPCTLVSRARTVELLALTGTKKKAVEEYTYPAKPKTRKASIKRGTVSKADYTGLSNDKLINSIKDMSVQLQALKDELNNRLK